MGSRRMFDGYWRILVGAAMMLVLASCSEGPGGGGSVTGTCPKCNAKVAGTLISWEGCDSKGRPIEESKYRAICPSCDASLYADDLPTVETKEVTWKLSTLSLAPPPEGNLPAKAEAPAD